VRAALDVERELPRALPPEHPLRFRVPERPDHAATLPSAAINVKRYYTQKRPGEREEPACPHAGVGRTRDRTGSEVLRSWGPAVQG